MHRFYILINIKFVFIFDIKVDHVMVNIGVNNTNVQVALLANQLPTHAMHGEKGKKFSEVNFNR